MTKGEKHCQYKNIRKRPHNENCSSSLATNINGLYVLCSSIVDLEQELGDGVPIVYLLYLIGPFDRLPA